MRMDAGAHSLFAPARVSTDAKVFALLTEFLECLLRILLVEDNEGFVLWVIEVDVTRGAQRCPGGPNFPAVGPKLPKCGSDSCDLRPSLDALHQEVKGVLHALCLGLLPLHMLRESLPRFFD